MLTYENRISGPQINDSIADYQHFITLDRMSLHLFHWSRNTHKHGLARWDAVSETRLDIKAILPAVI